MEEEEDTINLILQGCKLANDLEVSLPYMANQPTLLSNSCQDIISIFSAAKLRIDHRSPYSFSHCCLSPLHFDEQRVDPRIWNHPSILIPQSTYAAGTSNMEQRDAGNNVTMAGVIPGIPTADVYHERVPSTPSRRYRGRNNGEDSWTVKIAARRIDNMEIQPDDGYTWRKYGQKGILGSKFPRCYFRCTHRKLYQCPAKKQLQRLDSDPSTFEVTYRHLHTCHTSTTTPSLPQDMTTRVITLVPSQTPALTSTSGSSSTWIPVAFNVCGDDVTPSC